MTAFVAGATGYTGREVVRCLAAAGARVVAHVRPDSPRLEEWRSRFGALGAQVDTTPWNAALLAATIAAVRPDVVFCLVGTTRRRMRHSPKDPFGRPLETYDSVDYELTAMLTRACVMADVSCRFVYLSAAGTGPKARTRYGQARWRAEEAVRSSGLPWTIVRPAIISGPNRGEWRPLERAAAVLGDAALRLLSHLGFPGPLRRFASIDAQALAAALVRASQDPLCVGRVLQRSDL